MDHFLTQYICRPNCKVLEARLGKSRLVSEFQAEPWIRSRKLANPEMTHTPDMHTQVLAKFWFRPRLSKNVFAVQLGILISVTKVFSIVPLLSQAKVKQIQEPEVNDRYRLLT